MSLLLLWSARASATILLGLLLTLVLRRRSAAVRSVALRATLLAAWALPVAALVAPRVEVALPSPAIASEPLSLPAERSGGPLAPSKSTAPTPGSLQPATALETPSAPVAALTPVFDPLLWAERAYTVVALGLILRGLFALARLRRIARAASPLDPGTEPGVDLTSALGVPATFGLLRPRILLPDASKAWPDARIRAAVLHERAHVRRRDWAWQTLASLFAALHWTNPLAWLLARVLRDVAEAAADDEVLAQMGASDYARELLAVAASAHPVGPAVAMARRGGVRDRVVAILAANRDRRRPTLAVGGLLLLVLFAASLAVAGIRRAAGKPLTDKPGVDPRIVARAEEAGHGPVRLADGRTVELLDLGRLRKGVVSRWSPDGLPKERIVSPEAISGMVMGPFDQSSDQFLLRFRVRGAFRREASYDLKPDYGFEWSWYRSRDRSPTDGTILASLNPPKAQTTKAAVYVGFASGPWRTYRRSIPYGKSPTPAGPGQVSITFDRPGELEVDSFRVVAYDRKGRSLGFQGLGSMEKNGRTIMFATGSKENAARIARVDLQFRRNEWIRFSNLSLVARPASGAVRLTEIVGRDAAGNLASWSGEGKPLPPTPDDRPFAGFDESPDERLVRLQFRIDGPKNELPSVRFTVPPPVKLGAWGPVPLGTSRAMAVLRVPRGQRATDVRMGVADGPWLRYDRPFVRRPYGGRLREDLHGIEVVLPKPLRTEAVELRAYAGTRRIEPYTTMVGSDDAATTLVFQGDPKRVTRFEVWHRPYRWHEFKAVPLAPPAGPLYGPFAVTGGASVELVGVWTPGRDIRAWRPDGGATRLEPPVPYPVPAPNAYRYVLLAFLVRTPRLPVIPSLRVLEANDVRTSMSALGLGDPSRKNSGRVIWRMVAVPVARRLAEFGVEVEATPWERGATMARGTEMGQASWRTDGSHVVAGVPYTALTVRPRLMFGPTRAFRLTPVDAKGAVVASFGTTANADGTFTFSLAHPERVAGWRWETRPREVVRFRDVRLEPR